MAANPGPGGGAEPDPRTAAGPTVITAAAPDPHTGTRITADAQRHSSWITAVGGVLAAALALAGTIYTTQYGGDDKPDSSVSAPADPGGAPTPVPPAEAGAPSRAPSRAPSPTPSAPADAAPHPGEPLPMVLNEQACGTVLEIDFDKVPFTRRVVLEDSTGDDYEPSPGTDLTWSGCGGQTLATMLSSHAGLLAKAPDDAADAGDGEVTRDSCQGAAYGGGLEDVTMYAALGEGNPGFAKGVTMCVVTDQGRVVAAETTRMEDETAFVFTFAVRTLI